MLPVSKLTTASSVPLPERRSDGPAKARENVCLAAIPGVWDTKMLPVPIADALSRPANAEPAPLPEFAG